MIGKIWQTCRIPAAVLIALIPLAVMLLTGERGFPSNESSLFLMHYNSDASMLNLIFDPARTDWGLYQARELSYLIDCLDARFIAWCIGHHAAHFLSLSSMIFFALTIFVQQYFAAKCFPKADWPTALLPSLVFSCACVSSDHCFFRSSKPAVTFLVTLLLFTVVDLVKNHRTFKKEKMVSLILAAAALLLMPMFDRQGFFFVGAFTVITALTIAASGWKKCEKLLDLPETLTDLLQCLGVCGIAALMLSTCWNIFIAPEIIMALNNYYPSFEYQQLPFGSCFNFSGGVRFFFRNIGFLFFPFFPKWSGILGVAAVILSAGDIFFMEYRFRKPVLTVIFLLLVFFGICLGNLMTARHEMILNDSVLFGAYFLPLLGIFTGFIAVLLGEFAERRRSLLILLCVCATAGGIALKCKLISPPNESVDLQFFYKASAQRVIEHLNRPDSEKQMPLTLTNSLMIDFFRSRQNKDRQSAAR